MISHRRLRSYNAIPRRNDAGARIIQETVSNAIEVERQWNFDFACRLGDTKATKRAVVWAEKFLNSGDT